MIRPNRTVIDLILLAVLIGFAFAFSIDSAGQTLAPVALGNPAGGGAWWLFAGGLVALAAIIVAGFLWLKRRSPATATIVQAKVAQDAGDLARAVAAAVDRLIEARAAPPIAAIEPAIPTAPGKPGQAGPLTVECNGEPKADLAAFAAAYFG